MSTPMSSPVRRTRPVSRAGRVARTLLLGTLAGSLASPVAAATISCLGRLEPGDGVVRVASPSRGAGVIAELAVREGDRVKRGDVLATLDDNALRRADVNRLRAELTDAKNESERLSRLSKRSATSAAKLESAEISRQIAEANLEAAQAQLALTRVRAPIDGQVLEVHARAGERVGGDGVLELGDTRRMFAVAEVYETDVAKVAPGQRARIRSPAFPEPLGGTVERVGLKIGRMDVLDTDPVAKADARVVEVRIELDESDAVAGLTNLQVEVDIEVDP